MVNEIQFQYKLKVKFQMHIKNVAIEAFLTYEKLEMAELKLDKGCNLILGKNGSGKSNFLQGK